MNGFRKVPESIAKEWAPDTEEEPLYKTSWKLVKSFNELRRTRRVLFTALAVAALECAPVPLFVRWGVAALLLLVAGGLELALRRVQRRAAEIETRLTSIEVLPEKKQEESKEAPSASFFKESKA